MSKDFDLKAVISMVDRMSPGLKQITKNLNILHRQLRTVGNGAPMLGAGFVAAMAVPAKAFADLENAGTALKNTLMTKDGMSAGFEALNRVAIQLGNQLPGNTADFQRMATVMKANSMDTNTLIGGGLKAAAYLGVATKELGETYDSSALGIAKISNVLGVANSDFIALADTMQRARHIGLGFEDFTSAMSKAGGPLKALKVQGIGVANSLAPMVALLTQAGIDPSEAGSGIKEMISAAARAGKFTTVENLVKDVEKMAKLNPAKLFATFEKTFGKEHASKAMVMAGGGYWDMVNKFGDQGDVYQRVNNSLGTLTNTVDTLTGTMENMQAQLGGTYAPELKRLSGSLTEVAEKMAGFINENPQGIQTLIKMAGAFAGVKVAAWAAAGGVGLLTAAMKMNPWMLFAQAVIVAAPLIIDNFDKIKQSAEGLTQSMVDFLKQVNDNKVLKAIGSVPLYLGRSVGELLPDFPDLTVQGAGDMRPPGYYQKQSLIGGGRGAVDVRVSFGNSPSGMRVEPVKARGIANAKAVDVGYRTVGTRDA
ncbi:phage tail tape measure protein [Methylomonas sp. Kb3]|uniref:phage tail tape measure protein n=1 Tax=Methylomonas sp. Kb3 TaxID=1611544 RepID=UPI000C336863|nr:phage tail tape measure protein [Methylomonas sp. Kb3]PKD41451.1 phage tail tape measure protein [Methylomonas sp. Kb3]